MTPLPRRRRRKDMRPNLHPINEQSIIQKTLFPQRRIRNLHRPKLAIPIRQILDTHVLVIDFLVRAEGQVKHAERGRAELVHRGADGPFGAGRRRE